ncbi:histidine biosynthesis bifunctional protein HisIE [Synergistales bacterium]|nr:histidine biosynthesis bifunctional protein HisIE [Synergistales bacterium]
MAEWMKDIKFDGDGLVPIILQDTDTGEVLMMAWANGESLRLSEESGEMVFWSRSRREIWHKGLTSGNRMTLRELRLDCDGDAILALVEPMGPACHTGKRSCFSESLLKKGETEAGTFLGQLFRYLEKRANDSPEESYTARLIAEGRSRVAQKVGEEGVETALALATGDDDNFRYEAADLLYHLEVACVSAKIPLRDVIYELKSRHK